MKICVLCLTAGLLAGALAPLEPQARVYSVDELRKSNLKLSSLKDNDVVVVKGKRVTVGDLKRLIREDSRRAELVEAPVAPNTRLASAVAAVESRNKVRLESLRAQMLAQQPARTDVLRRAVANRVDRATPAACDAPRITAVEPATAHPGEPLAIGGCGFLNEAGRAVLLTPPERVEVRPGIYLTRPAREWRQLNVTSWRSGLIEATVPDATVGDPLALQVKVTTAQNKEAIGSVAIIVRPPEPPPPPVLTAAPATAAPRDPVLLSISGGELAAESGHATVRVLGRDLGLSVEASTPLAILARLPDLAGFTSPVTAVFTVTTSTGLRITSAPVTVTPDDPLQLPSAPAPFSGFASLYVSGAGVGEADNDEDGLRDDVEYALADHFKPYTIFDSDESARRSDEPRMLFQVRPVACSGMACAKPYEVWIKYVFLWARDGGYGPDSWCYDDHNGDDQPVTLRAASLGGMFWRLTAVLNGAGGSWPATAVEWYGRGPTIYMSAHKHHQYFNTARNHSDSVYSDWGCNDDVNGRGARVAPTLFLSGGPRNNVGEPERHPDAYFVNDLAAFAYPRENAWGTSRFCGGLGCDTDATTPIKDYWIRDGFVIRR